MMEDQGDKVGRSPLRGSGHSGSAPSPVPGLGHSASTPNAGCNRGGGQLTSRAKRFVALNRQNSVVMAEWLDEDRKAASGPPETWVKMRLRFDNMQQITLHEDDLASMNALGIKPIWYGDRRARATGAS